jgi:N-acetylglucosaminyldiphosphoundecaprenol N-acetyl-beta-D-mannosaminyltransferase
MGRQEFFIAQNIQKLDIGVAIGVGGAFDYISTVKRRAPQIMQKTGFEWLWRLAAQPSRARRMLAVFPLFWILIALQKLQIFGEK